MRLQKLALGLFVLTIFGVAAPAAVGKSFADGQVVEELAYSFPAYGKVEGIEFYTDRTEYEASVNDSAFRFRKLKYVSDGLKVVAYLYQPTQTGSKKLPLIIFNRGSGPAGDSAPLLVSLFHRLAAQGFVVLAPQYRGSDGGEGHDEIGGADMDDVKNLIPLARSLGFVDINNVFMYGESRGGMMTYQAIRDAFPINAAAVFGAFTDLEVMNQPPYVQKLIPQIWPDYDTHKEEIIRRRSAKYWPEKFYVPVLIMNGGADQQVDPSQPLQLALQLQQLGKTYGLIIYSGDNHFLQSNRDDRDRKALAWFTVHLKK
jgi:dipeptidyl aminopeptidase/acylaminoacyl peptidase